MATHMDENGNAVMVDVSAKSDTVRTAVAEGRISVSPAVMAAVRHGAGDNDLRALMQGAVADKPPGHVFSFTSDGGSGFFMNSVGG